MYNDLILIIAGIISLILFVAILYITGDVSKIKLHLRKKDAGYWRNQAAKNLFFLNNQLALAALQEALWIELHEAMNKKYFSKKQKVQKLESIVNKYKEKMSELGGSMKNVEDLA